MPMKIAENTSAVAAVPSLAPLPLAQRMQERQPEKPRERDENDRDEKWMPDTGRIPTAPMLIPIAEEPLLSPRHSAAQVLAAPARVPGQALSETATPGAALQAEADALQAEADKGARVPAVGYTTPHQNPARAGEAAPMSPTAAPIAPPEKALEPARGDAEAAPVPRQAEPAAQPGVSIQSVPSGVSSAAGAVSEALHQAHHQASVSSQHQQVKATEHAQSMQQAQMARMEAGTRIDVAFRSWGGGHVVTARVDGTRLQLQPSSSRLQQALSGAALPGDVDLEVAIGEANDQQGRRKHERSAS